MIVEQFCLNLLQKCSENEPLRSLKTDKSFFINGLSVFYLSTVKIENRAEFSFDTEMRFIEIKFSSFIRTSSC